MSQTDAETVARAIETYLKANLNTFITNLNTEKNDSITLKTISTDAYFFQSLNEKVANYDPYFLLHLDNIGGVGIRGATSQIFNFSCGIIVADRGEDLFIGYRMLRYGRVLTDIFNDGYGKILKHVNFTVQSLVPVVIPSVNSIDPFRAVGIAVEASIS